MMKIKKAPKLNNIAFIFMLIGVILCQNLTYASDTSCLRVPVGIKYERIRDLTEKFQERGGRYEWYGDPDGIPLIFIPGIDGVTDTYSSQRDSFKKEGFYVVVYHFPLAEEAEAEGKDYSFEYIAQDLHEVMEELGVRKSYIIATSFGSLVAQYFTIIHPDKVGGLVLVSPAAYLELPLRLRILSKLLPIIPLSLSVRKFARNVISKKDDDFRRKRKEYRERGIRSTTRKTTIARAKLATEADLRTDLPKIEHDVMIVYGGYDGFMGKRDALRLKEALVNANVEVIQMESGHMPQWTNPEVFTKELRRFL